MSKRWLLLTLALAVLLGMLGVSLPAGPALAQGGVTPTPRPLYDLPDPNAVRVWRSAVIALTRNQRRAVTANTFSDTASIVDIVNETILAEVPVGREPRALTVAPDERWMAVTARREGTVTLIDLETFAVINSLWVGLWPWGVVTDGATLYVALEGEDAIAEIDVASLRVLRLMPVPDAPAALALWGNFLYITHFTSGALTLLYLPTGEVADSVPGTPDSSLSAAIWLDPFDAVAYVPATRMNADNPLLTFDSTVFPVVNAFGLRDLGALRARRVALDVADRPLNMPFDVSLDRPRRWLWVVNGGSDDVSVIDLNTGFARANMRVGANPRGIARTSNGSFAYVYNALDGTISVIESAFMEVVDTLAATELDMPIELLIGAQLFHGSADPRLSEDRRLSCATCHFDGGDDGRVWVGWPGGARNTPSLWGARETAPWGWRGDRDELADFNDLLVAVQHGEGLLDEAPPDGVSSGRSPDLDALVAYLSTLEGPGRNALRIPPEEVLAGEAVWTAQGCAECHPPPLYTDGLAHDLGDGPVDTPSLRWLWATAPYTHDGSAPTLLDVFAADAGPHHLLGVIPYDELDRLITYLRSLPLE